MSLNLAEILEQYDGIEAPFVVFEPSKPTVDFNAFIDKLTHDVALAFQIPEKFLRPLPTTNRCDMAPKKIADEHVPDSLNDVEMMKQIAEEGEDQNVQETQDDQPVRQPAPGHDEELPPLLPDEEMTEAQEIEGDGAAPSFQHLRNEHHSILDEIEHNALVGRARPREWWERNIKRLRDIVDTL